MINTIYAVYDELAQSIVGGLFLHRHDAAAVRFFNDVASDPNTSVAKHIADHSLIAIADIDIESGIITTTKDTIGQIKPRTVLTGAAWKAAQDAAAANLEEGSR